jgi:Flp pilus assembly protein TadB
VLEAILPLAALAALAVVVYLWYGVRLQGLTRQRLAAATAPGHEGPPPVRARRFPRRFRLLPWLLGVALFFCLHFLVGLQLAYALAFGLIFGLLASQVEAFVAARRVQLIEAQLGDALDLMVGALRAGASVLAALDNAVEEVRTPLRPQLEEVLGRIRYGDDPQAVLKGLVERVPLEAFRLFAAALSVHWEVGGSLAPTLATVGRTIRDRIAIGRRIGSLTAQTRFSVGAVLLVTYFIAMLMWRTDPPRMTEFLSSGIGQALVAGVLVLQAIGIVWAALLSRVKF